MHASLPNNSKKDLLSHFFPRIFVRILKILAYFFQPLSKLFSFFTSKMIKSSRVATLCFLYMLDSAVSIKRINIMYVYSVNVKVTWKTRNVHFHSLYPLFLYFPNNFRLPLSMNTTVLYQILYLSNYKLMNFVEYTSNLVIRNPRK